MGTFTHITVVAIEVCRGNDFSVTGTIERHLLLMRTIPQFEQYGT